MAFAVRLELTNRMLQYVGIRLASIVPILLGVSVLIFALMQMIPGDIIDVVAGDQAHGDPRAVARLREQLHLDRPVIERYLLWLGNALHGDLGRSFVSGQPVLDQIMRRLPLNLELAGLAIAFALVLGIPAGVLSAVYRRTWVDSVIRFGAVLGYSVPNFWVATVVVLLGSLYMQWLPILAYVPFGQDPWAHIRLLVIPSFVLSLTVMPLVVRMTRSATLENLRLDYVRTARAKGLPETRVISRHVLSNSLIAILNVTGVQLGILIGGLVLTEEIFILPGVGRLLLEALHKRDLPLVVGTVLFLVVAFILVNLIVDLLHAYLDPRVRS